MREKSNLLRELAEKDNELEGSNSILGMTVLSQPGYMNSMRAVMNTAHDKQFVDLLKPEFPSYFTNAENVVGKYSSGYKKLKHTSTVYKKIGKFDDILGGHSYFGLVFMVDDVNKKFSVIHRKELENLTEVFGFQYQNEVIDSLREGDEVKKGTVLYKSTSYDENMNYGYGLNVPFMYVSAPQTCEDAAVVSSWLAERMTSIEVKTTKIDINDNHYLLNLYGDDNSYKPLPDIGEYTKNGVIAAKRTMFTSQLLNDFTNAALRKINYSSDSVYYSDGNAQIVDINVYCNNDDLVENSFNRQIVKYLNSQTKYNQEIVDTCEEIFKTGYKVSSEIKHLYARAKQYLNTEYKGKEGDGVFSNLVIEITVRKVIPLQIGQKITGRYGNKSVVSKIVPTYLMPHREDGQPIHLLLSEYGIINRTTAAPLIENTLTFMLGRTQQHARTLSTLKEKEDFIFDVISMLNSEQSKKMRSIYNSLSKKEKEAYIDACINERMFIHHRPLWEDEPMFLKINKVYKKYGDIFKPYDIYVYRFGRWIKSFNQVYCGEQYIMKLKQTSRKGYSARATGAINMTSLPEKSHAHKNGTNEHSESTVRFGEFETLNFQVAMIPHEIAEFFAVYRTSIKGRRDLAASLLAPEGKYKMDGTYTSRVNEIFSVFLKSIGIELQFDDDSMHIDEYDDEQIKEFQIDDQTILCTEWEFHKEKLRVKYEKEILQKFGMMDEKELQNKVDVLLNEELGKLGVQE